MNLTELESRLRARLKQCTVKLFQNQQLAGLSDWNTQTIHLNPTHGPLLETLIHELLHLELRNELNHFNLDLEEVIVRALADKTTRFINKSKSRTAFWTRQCGKLT